MKQNIEHINFFIQYGQKLGYADEEILEGLKQFFSKKYNII